uniref:NTF2 domain-containing protein n=1 Tax=Heterorhabditis bacteriophora TaxID=37862 RepID=A0A1I7XEN5_HETBA
MSFNPDYENIATAFVQHYYSKFDQGDGMARAQGLSDLYDPENSYMTFEGVQCKGRDGILAKFSTDDDPINPFSQIFILRPNSSGSYFIGNEIFRLDLHNN